MPRRNERRRRIRIDSTHRLSQQRGFTLVEVLVALLVMALMAGMAWQGVSGVMKAREVTQAHLEQTLRLATIVAQWDQDLASIQDSRTVPPITFDGATLRLTRRTNTGLQVVAWSLHPEMGSGTWLRWAGPPVNSLADLQDQWFRTQQFQGVEAGQMRTVSGVTQWQVYFYRGNAWTNAQSTADQQQPVASPLTGASGAQPTVKPATVLPTGVRIIVGFGPGSGHDGSLVRDVALGPVWQ